MWSEYLETMRSHNADLRNSGSPAGGAITAGSFLSCFAEDTSWVHLDIAGTAWTDSASDADKPMRGATASGVRTLVELALSAPSS